MSKIKTCLKMFLSVFMFLLAVSFALKTNVYAAAGSGATSGLCTLGARGTCPKIGSFKRADGAEIWPAQAEVCECSIPAAGINKGQWTTCEYPSAEFYDVSGSCANNNYKVRKCNFTQQSIACNSSSVSVKYTCGAWENGDCTGSCSPTGSKEEKYTASGCSYSTQTRTCCSNGKWSEWNGSCSGAGSCSSSQCWNGSSCANKESVSRSCSGNVTNAQSGTQTRTATCTSGSGWTYGFWTGTCTCKTGYTWNGSSCVRDNPPTVKALGCQAVPGDSGKDPGHTWAGVEVSSSPSAAMYVILSITGEFNGSTLTSYSHIRIDIPAGFPASGQKSMEFEMPLPDGCSNCSYNNCKAMVQSVGWQ